jgi:mannose-6-phosphate isomerase-like protein (cupin superfamily)
MILDLLATKLEADVNQVQRLKYDIHRNRRVGSLRKAERSMAQIIRFNDLEPSWTTKQAKEPGFMRWLITWVGGPAGHINTNPGIAVESTQCAVGMMYLPRGQRQAGKHTHGVTEIYVVLQGKLDGFDASGRPHRAGPLDCTYIPAGCPHGVRNCGLQDVVLIWVHDGIERSGTAVYYADDHEFTNAPPIELVRFADLEPDWSGPGARTPGTMRWSVDWVGNRATAAENRSAATVPNPRVAIGLTVLEPGHSVPAEPLPVPRLYLVAEGQAITDIGENKITLGYLDGLHLPAAEQATLRNNGPQPLRLLWVDTYSAPLKP